MIALRAAGQTSVAASQTSKWANLPGFDRELLHHKPVTRADLADLMFAASVALLALSRE
jgi:hypothetical protein